MFGKRPIAFAAAAVLAASATTAICFGDALGLVPASAAAAAAAAANGGPSSPIGILQHARPWLPGANDAPPSLKGKVVLVNFWTYSCINSLRALPYLRAWQERYGPKGLVVIGVHAPEFQFEHDPANVRQASAELGLRYPVLQDNDYAVWQKYGNQGWPGFYFIDSEGRVRAYRVGEGNYAESEMLIRKLLAEAGHDPADVPMAPITGTGIEAEADWADLGSPEAYLGYAKARNFRSPGGTQRNVEAHYAPASGLPLNGWDLGGLWNVGPEYARLAGKTGTLRFRFHARDAHLVLGGASDGQPIRIRVTLDGAPPGPDHGTDVDPQGWGEVREDRLYQLIRQTGEIRDRTVTIEFSRPGARLYSFTFG